MNAHQIEVAELVEGQPLGKFQLFVLGCCFLILFVDGFDYSSANVGAPAIIRAFQADKSAMGLVFGWGNFGILCGSFLFGYIGDKLGRKAGSLGGVLFYSLPALLIYFADSLQHLMVLRFLAGLGIGGVIPNAIALLTETAPKKYRASFVMLGLVAYSTGTFASAQVSAWLTPIFGWRVGFVTAGGAGVLLCLYLAFVLPESIRYLALTQSNSDSLKALVRRIAPSLPINSETRFYLNQGSANGSFSWRQLFSGYQRVATPLLWIGYFAESLTFMTYASWLGVILESKGLAPQQAAFAFSFTAVGGICAIIIMSRFLDYFGPMATVVTALGGVSLISLLGTEGLSIPVIIGIAVLAMGCCHATHNSFNGTVGIFYPTSIRSKGVGYASGMGRIALITGPVVAGYLLSAHLPTQTLLYLIAAPYVLVTFVCFGLGRLYQRRFAGGEAAAQASIKQASEISPMSSEGVNPDNIGSRA
jgi:AAHS family 4-hydroxybenzoate transporter-like MFS transporter